MKRYLTFAGEQYPKGGIGDLLATHSEKDLAIKALDYTAQRRGVDDFWGHIWDCETEEIVYEIKKATQ